MQLDYAGNEANVKIALVGPIGAGKRSIGAIFHPMASPRGKPNWPDRIHAAIRGGAWFFDFLPARPAQLHGRAVRIHIHSLHEPVKSAALEYTLDDADAVIFVADSTGRDANLAALERVTTWGGNPDVFVLNKRDCEGSAAVDVLAVDLGIGSRPTFEGIATQKLGVIEAVKAAVRMACEGASTRSR